MRLSAEQQARIDEAAQRKTDLDRRAANVIEETKRAMRQRGEPVREDFPNRDEYRRAAAQFRRKGKPQ